MLGWVDRRCRQATGCKEQRFGGISAILIGDPAQLLPVGDKPLYHSNPSNKVAKQGCMMYLMFNKVIKLLINQRIIGNNPQQQLFRELLERLRTGDSTEEDWKRPLTRQPFKVSDLNKLKDTT